MHPDPFCSDGDDLQPLFDSHIREVRGADIDVVFESQYVTGVFGNQKKAFTDPDEKHRTDDLHARLFHSLIHDVYFLVFQPTTTFDDKLTDVQVAMGIGIPDQFKQAKQILTQVKPNYRTKLVVTGYSLGGGLAAYAAIETPWPVRTVVFDALGLNRNMLGKSGWRPLGQRENLSDQIPPEAQALVEWFYIADSWVPKINIERHLSSVGRVTELPNDPVLRENGQDSHSLRHVRYGLQTLWTDTYWRGTANGT